MLLLAVASAVSAETLPIRSFSAADGLAEGHVNAIAEDSRGFVWFATSGGLSRFDGYRFVTWSAGQQASYRGSNALLMASNGDYWVATGKGVLWFGTGGPMQNKLLRPDSGPALISDLIRMRSGKLLASTRLGILEIVEGRRIVRAPFPPTLAPHTAIGAIAEDGAGDLWIAIPPDGLKIYNPAGSGAAPGEVVSLPKTVTNVNAMLEAPAGYMWVATNEGLARYQKTEGETAWRLSGTFSLMDGLPGREVTTLLRKSDGTIWAGTTKGIAQFSVSEAAHPRFSSISLALGLPDTNITALAEDHAGNVWAGTESGGVMLLKAHGFKSYRQEDGISIPFFRQVLEDRQGVLVAVGDGNGPSRASLAVFDGRSFHQQPARLLGSSRVPWSWQRVLIQSQSGEWWAAAANGLCRYPAIPARVLANARPTICYTREKIFHLFEDSRGNIWASATDSQALLRWNRNTGRAVYLSGDGAESETPCTFGALIASMAEDGHGNVWLGGWSGELYRYGNGRFERLGPAEGAPRGTVHSLYTDSAGRLWSGSFGGGLGLVKDPAAARPGFFAWNTSNGLNSDDVLCITEDRFGRIWAATSRGVASLDPGTGAIQFYSEADGLPQASYKSAMRDRSGALWFATSHGLTRIVPERSMRSAPPEVLFTRIRIADEEFPIAALGAKRVDRIVLGPERNHVQIEFAAPGSDSASYLRYRFLLDGASGGWSAPQAGNGVDYRNLGSGNYRFLVKSVNLDGMESANAAEFDFRILPPVWMRWWFLLTIALALSSAMFWLHRYRLFHLLAVERMRTEIATDLHDDIGASLTRIAILSDVSRLNLRNSPETDQAPLARIGGMARELLDSLDDIVWSVRATEVNVDSLVGRMREFALDVLAQRGATFSLECDEALRSRQLGPDTRRHLLLIFKECMHNVAKHSDCNSAHTVLHLVGGKLTMTVSDNGRGAAAAAASNGRNGMASMRRRARAMRGEIEFGNGPAGGYVVTVRIPLPSAGLARAWRV
jgi:ligand-binding sensor domain-containing protein/two-component sensor histidine kinase